MEIRSHRAQILLVFAEEETRGAIEEFGNLENNIHRIIKPKYFFLQRIFLVEQQKIHQHLMICNFWLYLCSLFSLSHIIMI